MLKQRQGFILIFTLWVLGFLTVLIVGLTAGIRQKIVLLEKLDQRSRISHLLEASVKYSCAYVSNQLNASGQVYNATIKMKLHNNPEAFGQFSLADDTSTISYTLPNQTEVFGVVDEERKINLNTTNTFTLSRLIERVLSLKPDTASAMAADILDWRQLGESQIVGFYSQGYYENLEFPYVKKNANYESLDELLLVKGITKDIYDKLINFVTIYGDGKVNINTAPDEVLYALGLDDDLLQTILEAREGKDKIEATGDDHVFLKSFDVANEINSIIKLNSAQIRTIDIMNQQGLLTTVSYYFSVEAVARLAHNTYSKKVRAVISARENKIVYWSER